jgi:hypothetical protein
MSRIQVARHGALLVALLALVACGQSETVQTAAEESGGETQGPCSLLSKLEVQSVVPGTEDGMVMHSGGSLIKGVDSYQCSYMDMSGPALTVIWHRAADAALFEEIKPDFSLIGSARDVDVGNRGWIIERDSNVKVTAIVNHTKLELQLMSDDARKHSARVVELARKVAAKLSRIP